MDMNALQIAQAYLTMGERKIVDLETLFKRHPAEKVISFLEFFLKDLKADIKDFVILGIADGCFDRAVLEWFRLNLAINVLRQGATYEYSTTEQGTRASL